jgi:S-DNA-T family DNA segregation ATPase FtsK/SpoIIIE
VFRIFSLICAFVLIYFSYSIIVIDKNLIGLIGFSVATFSHKNFGYLSYIYIIILLYPLYKFNFTSIYFDKKDLSYKIINYIFTFIILLILQSLIISNNMQGFIGVYIVQTLNPYIGLAGVWILLSMGLLSSGYLFITENEHIFINLSKKIKKSKQLLMPYNSTNKKVKRANKPKEQKIIIKEVGNTAEITILKESKKKKIIKNTVDDNAIQFKITQEDEEIQNISQKEEFIEEKIDFIKEAELHHNATIVNELEENKKLQEDIELGIVEKPKDFMLPPSNFFAKSPKTKKSKINEEVIDQKIRDLLEKLRQFKIDGDIIRTYTGPIVTTFEFKPAPNVKVSKILNLQDDLAMALKATTIRIQAPIPGKDVVGIEVPNEELDTIYLREILESDIFRNSKSPLTMILGKDIVGQPFITDLKKLPHLLIAGTTGSGKSVGINSMILSLLYKNSPDTLKLIMIDPKMLEFSMYNDIPHLLTPVITKPMEAINALANTVKEMEKRYKMMADTRTKNIENYNEKAENNGYDEFPYIVIIIDELADLMMTSGKEVEISVARLAQMARASGIHLIVATQRPSVDVVTGLIKANLPSRISYKVGQKIDSKIILDSMGAESLLGRGDMLFTPPGMSSLVRVHAPWSTEDEIDKVVEFLKDQREVSYDMSFVKEKGLDDLNKTNTDIGELDELFEQAKLIVAQDNKSSISYIQRRLKIGYNRAATIVEQLEATGILSAPNTKGNREILI